MKCFFDCLKIICPWGFPGGPVVKVSPSNSGGMGSTLGQRAEIPHSSGPLPPKTQNVKQKQYYNKFHQNFKNCPSQKIFKKKEEKNNRIPSSVLTLLLPLFPSPAHLHPPLTSLTVSPQPRSAPWTPHKYPSPHPWKGLV